MQIRALLLSAAVTGVLVVAAVPGVTSASDDTKYLRRVRGSVGYQTRVSTPDFKPVFGMFALPDSDYAVTHAKSAAVILMPDSSSITLGENTVVQVGAFGITPVGPGSGILVAAGRLRFDILRPAGGAANYRILTPTSQIAVHGTAVVLASFIDGVTTVGCVACAADSVVVTAMPRTITLATGQSVAVSAQGAMKTGPLRSVVDTFVAGGVPVTAQR